ncbi:MAG: hypothetical protein WC623_24575 [Pedobacter sp.]|uniref:hypothetical protein n=1 Tax=Pedobacter sp. TaxID=1411316 RepID=UPI00356B5A1D
MDNINIEPLIQNLIDLYFKNNNEKICEMLGIEYDPDYKSSIDESRYKLNNEYKYHKENNGMIFHNDENPTTVERVNVDEETKYLLSILKTITTYVIDERYLIDDIIIKWTKNKILISKIERQMKVGECIRHQVKVGEKNWTILSNLCKNNGIPIKDGFKLSIMNYFKEIDTNNSNLNINLK